LVGKSSAYIAKKKRKGEKRGKGKECVVQKNLGVLFNARAGAILRGKREKGGKGRGGEKKRRLEQVRHNRKKRGRGGKRERKIR